MTTAKSPAVICGTDFSVHAAEAADVAAAMAQRLRGPLQLVHVTEPQDERTAGARLHREAERLRSDSREVQESLLFGSPYETLVQQSGNGASTIVVSSLGRIAPSRFLVGSTAERTAELAPIPTLVVRRSDTLLAWLRGESPLNVCIGCDFSETSDAALRWVKTLLDLGPCVVTAVHLWWPAGYHPHGRHPESAAADAAALVQQEIESELRDRIARIFQSAPVQTRVEPCWGRVDVPLLTIAQQAHADLVVVGSHQRHGVARLWLGSVSRAVLHAAPMNVAVVPAPRRRGVPDEKAPTFRRVLVPTDLSEHANHAIPLGYASVAPGGTVWLLHVVEPLAFPAPPGPQFASAAISEQQQHDEIRSCLDALHRLIPAESDHRSLRSEVEVLESTTPARAICDAAQRIGADLICMATHARSAIHGAMLRSVALRVLSRAPCPVLLVPPRR
jgi:nucleotide-binding universal stress UspA family protein